MLTSKLRNEKLRNFYYPPNIIRMIKSKRRRATGHVERMDAMRYEYKILVGRPNKKRSLGRPTINRMVFLKYRKKYKDGGCGMGS